MAANQKDVKRKKKTGGLIVLIEVTFSWGGDTWKKDNAYCFVYSLSLDSWQFKIRLMSWTGLIFKHKKGLLQYSSGWNLFSFFP